MTSVDFSERVLVKARGRRVTWTYSIAAILIFFLLLAMDVIS